MKTRELLTIQNALWKAAIFIFVAAAGGCGIALGLDVYGEAAGAACDDGEKSPGETGVDCGGPCKACADNEGCMVGTDCASLVCEGNLCREPTCADGVKNGDELGVDCRGKCVDQKCPAGEGCQVGADCIGGQCVQNVCIPTCEDGELNGKETGKDCGGPACGACGNGVGCVLNGDCGSGVCENLVCVDFHRFSKGFVGVFSLPFFTSSIFVDSKSNDRIAVGGSLIGSVDFGKGFETTQMNDYSNVYLAQFDGDGNCLWSNSFGDVANPQVVTSISMNDIGEIAISGWFYGSLNFGGGVLPGDTMKSNAFIAVFNQMGQHMWSRSIGNTADDRGSGIAINSAGEVLATGYFAGSMDVGGKMLTSVFNTTDVYLIRYQNNGTALWAKSFGDAAIQYEPLLAENNKSTCVLAGKLNGSIDFGGGLLTASPDPAIENIFIAAFNQQGAHLWSHSFAHTIPNESFGITDVAIDDNDNTTIIGSFSKSIQFITNPNTQNLSAAGQTDIFVAHFDPTGILLWANAYGNTDFETPHALDVTPDGSLLLTGAFRNTIEFNGHTLPSTGNESIFITKLSPSGQFIWARAFGQNQNILASDITAQGPADIITTSLYGDKLNYGGMDLPVPSQSLAFGLAGLKLPIQ